MKGYNKLPNTNTNVYSFTTQPESSEDKNPDLFYKEGLKWNDIEEIVNVTTEMIQLCTDHDQVEELEMWETAKEFFSEVLQDKENSSHFGLVDREILEIRQIRDISRDPDHGKRLKNSIESKGKITSVLIAVSAKGHSKVTKEIVIEGVHRYTECEDISENQESFKLPRIKIPPSIESAISDILENIQNGLNKGQIKLANDSVDIECHFARIIASEKYSEYFGDDPNLELIEEWTNEYRDLEIRKAKIIFSEAHSNQTFTNKLSEAINNWKMDRSGIDKESNSAITKIFTSKHSTSKKKSTTKTHIKTAIGQLQVNELQIAEIKSTKNKEDKVLVPSGNYIILNCSGKGKELQLSTDTIKKIRFFHGNSDWGNTKDSLPEIILLANENKATSAQKAIRGRMSIINRLYEQYIFNETADVLPDYLIFSPKLLSDHDFILREEAVKGTPGEKIRYIQKVSKETSKTRAWKLVLSRSQLISQFEKSNEEALQIPLSWVAQTKGKIESRKIKM